MYYSFYLNQYKFLSSIAVSILGSYSTLNFFIFVFEFHIFSIKNSFNINSWVFKKIRIFNDFVNFVKCQILQICPSEESL